MPAGESISNSESGAPLLGRSVLVTRASEQSEALAAPLRALGAEVISMPVIQVVDPVDFEPFDRALDELGGYDWLVVTSTNGVERFLDRLAERCARDLPAKLKIAVVGRATADRLRDANIEPHLVPTDFRAEGLAEAMRAAGVGPGSRVLIARAEQARAVLPEELTAAGADVDVVTTYRLVPRPPDPAVAERLRQGSIDLATFASGATFDSFLGAVEAAGLDARAVLEPMAIASVGPVTSSTIREHGFEVDVEATESTMPSLVESIAEYFCRDGKARLSID